MKKIYNAPLTEVVKINVEQMICESFEVKAVPYTESTMEIGDKEENQFFDPNLW